MDIWDFLSNYQAPRRSRPHVRWSLPSGKNRFKSHRFWAPRRPGVAPLRDPVPKNLHFSRKRFRTRACTDLQCTFAQKCFFCNVKKVRSKDLIGYAAWGLPQGPAFACTLTISNKTKKQKLKKRKFCLGFLYQINIFAARCENTKCLFYLRFPNKTCVFLVFACLFC